MSDFVIPAPLQASVAVAGTDARFPVRRIFCVGRNYAEHAREMGNDPDREPPFFFTKPADALVAATATIPYPPATENLHFEAELVVAIGKGGKAIDEGAALGHVWGYAAGNDLTRRDLQAEAKSLRRPWDMAKGFDLSAVCGALVAVSSAGHPPASATITCTVNGETRQSATLGDMIWPVPAIIAYLSRLVELQPGDLIYTGTPAGVGAIKAGDVCRVSIDGLGAVTTTIA
ncbi:MAG: fumarylacetoacetate hydrolase family protein [Paracoccaceae bacterium]|nr:fumarylacetoacetate hydrolase family protein [Paracoccaceae bacterium]